MCKKLNGIKIIQRFNNGILSGTYKTEFQYNDILINIQQSGLRQTILLNENNNIQELFNLFNSIDRFMQIFDGKFIPIQSIVAIDEQENEIAIYQEDIKKFLNSRLSYFSSEDIYLENHSKLCEPIKYFNENMLKTWLNLQTELDIIHQSMLYFTCDNHMPIDIRLAHIIETFEPLSEFISEIDKSYIPRPLPPDKKVNLKSHIDSIICKYGKKIFDLEYSVDKEKFLQLVVNTRVRIMHTKRKFQKPYIKGSVLLMYCGKFVVLYRKILLTLLGVNEKDFIINLNNDIDGYNKHLNLINDFIKNNLN